MLGATALGSGGLLRSLRAACAVLACLAAGALALGSRLDAAARGAPREPLEADVEGRVREVVQGAGWVRVELADVVGVEPHAPRPPVRLPILGRTTASGVDSLAAALPGDRLRARVRWRATRERHNPGGRPRVRAAARDGVGAQAALVHPALHVQRVEPGGLRLLAGLHRLRARLAVRLVAAGPGGGLLAALALGDRRGLSPATRDALSRIGVGHLLAVSGLHLGLVAGLAFALGRALLRRSASLALRRDTRRLAVVGALAVALGYGLLTGWGIPVRRAAILLAAAVLAVVRSRPGRRGDPLALASLAVLTVEPAALFQAGPQLSFAAAAALMFAGRRHAVPRGRLQQLLGDGLRASAAATAATAPIAALQLGRVAPFALAVNAVAIPWTACVLLPAALAAAAIALAPAGGPADSLLAFLAGVANSSLAAATALADRLPASGAVGPPDAAWLACAGGLALLAIAARRTWTRVGLAALVGSLLAVAPPPALSPAPPRVVALDVGQGDATLIQGRGASVLVDAGTALPGGADLGRSTVVPALLALGVRRLDLLVASHADLDHRGGLPAVLAGLDVAELWVPHAAAEEPGFATLLRAARSRGVPIRERGAGSPGWRAGDVAVTPLWPPPGSAGGARNDRSLVVRVAVGRRRVLLAGDLEAEGEAGLLASGADLRADVLKLAHHGSRTSSSEGFLAAVDAAVAIVSAPEHSRFGMPHPEVVGRVRDAGASLWWTGRDGAVFVALDTPLRVRGFREP